MQDRYYIEHHSLPSLRDSGLAAFKSVVFTPVRSHITQHMLDKVDLERDGEVVDRALLKSCSEVFVAMGMGRLDVYHKDLEAPLLQSTRTYFSAAAAQWLTSLDVPSYLQRAEAALTAEAIRVQHYLHESTEGRLLGVLEEVLLQAHQADLLGSPTGVSTMLERSAQQDLARMYRLFSRVNGGLIPLARAVREHIQRAGLAMVATREDATKVVPGAAKPKGAAAAAADVQFVKDLLDLLHTSKTLITGVFGGHSLFQKALKDAFEVFVNKDVACKTSNTVAIAAYADRLLRAGGERLSDDATEKELQRVLGLFTYIVDKDMFGESYRQALSKRLLSGRSASREAEKSMVSKLKLACGAQYTSKLEGMLKDLEQGQESFKAFDSWVAARREEGDAQVLALPKYDFAAHVLTTGWWPASKHIPLSLPPPMLAWQNMYERYYSSTTTVRRLQWVAAQGTAVVKGNFAVPYDFTVTTLQAATLLFFNEVPAGAALSLKDVISALGCSEDVVKRVLHSLSCGKYKVLNKTPPGRTIGAADTFAVNGSFQASARKIRVPMASLEDTGSVKRVQEDRRVAIDAAIVRIMKSRQTLTHQALFAEVLSALSLFQPNPKLIKRRIEYMLDADYIERDDDDVNTYHYVA